jgi:hypothetical protein
LTNLSANLGIADMIVIAFLFLLQPGEYTGTHWDTTPFRFADVQLFAGLQRLDLHTAMEEATRGHLRQPYLHHPKKMVFVAKSLASVDLAKPTSTQS